MTEGRLLADAKSPFRAKGIDRIKSEYDST